MIFIKPFLKKYYFLISKRSINHARSPEFVFYQNPEAKLKSLLTKEREKHHPKLTRLVHTC